MIWTAGAILAGVSVAKCRRPDESSSIVLGRAEDAVPKRTTVFAIAARGRSRLCRSKPASNEWDRQEVKQRAPKFNRQSTCIPRVTLMGRKGRQPWEFHLDAC